MWTQKQINLPVRSRGFHLITAEIMHGISAIKQVEIGLLHLLIQHTSASLAINENADPDVRDDMEAHFNQYIPENAPYYKHTQEGSDDMPAHIKSVVLGVQLTLPIAHGQLRLGMWQGIYLCEHRTHASSRTIIATLNGQ